jgi:hypothetical protein
MLKEERFIQFRRHNAIQSQLRLVIVPDSCAGASSGQNDVSISKLLQKCTISADFQKPSLRLQGNVFQFNIEIIKELHKKE